MSRAKKNTERDFAGDVRTLRADIRKSTKKVVDDVKNVGAAAYREAGSEVERGLETAADYLHQGREMATGARRNLDEQIRSQPIKSLLIATGIGMGLGFFLARRR